MASELSIKITDGSDASVKVVSLYGELDESNLESLKAQVDPLLNDLSIKTIILNFKGLQFINSKGIGFLVAMKTHMAKSERSILLADGSESVMDVISLVGLTQIIPHFDKLEDALANIIG